MTAHPLAASAAARYQRARRDPLGALIASCCEAGVRFRVSGADLIVDGTGQLPPDDLGLLRAQIDAVRERLAPTPPGGDLLEQLGIPLELVTTEARAQEVVAGLPPTVGFDTETEPLPEHAPPPAWLAITKAGQLAKHQPLLRDKTGLDPHRARPRLVQIYDPRAEVVYVVDLRTVPLAALEGLWQRRLVIHNAAFEIAMLHGLPRSVICTMQLAGLVYGTTRGARRLAIVAENVLGVTVPKDLQTSDWAAARLSSEQLSYAGLDAVLAHRAAGVLWRALEPDARPAFAAQNNAVPVIAGMRVQGIPFDVPTHLETTAAWEVEQAEAREAFVAAAGEDVPQQGPRRSAWLLRRLRDLEADDVIRWWPRTKTGALSTSADHLKRLAWCEWARPLIAVAKADQRLSSFGRKLVAAINPVTGRLHGDLIPCGQKSGRTSCSSPNLLGLPPAARRAVVAPAGRVLVVADFGQVELRIAAELSGDPTMRQALAEGRDLHVLTASAMTGAAEADVTAAQRKAAKPVNFGNLYGQGAKRLMATAWADYDIDLTLAEAEAARAALRARYPVLLHWQRRMINLGQHPGILRSKLGRPLRREWEDGGEIGYSLSLNFPIQSSAADVLLVAMAKAAAALEGIDATIILQVHDELVVEAAEQDAPTARDRLVEAMTEAFLEVFPEAPTTGLVDVATVGCWAEAKG
ncbi:MAG: polymerase family protein with 3-5-exonuclease and polymerase domain [Geminicoccaceae bacterium]|nr:polymerase family protein with 3-5-exonuclease and polymerase domain [Geminicoccaceae bacterium]